MRFGIFMDSFEIQRSGKDSAKIKIPRFTQDYTSWLTQEIQDTLKVL